MKYKNFQKILISKNTPINQILYKIKLNENNLSVPKNLFIITNKQKKILGTLTDGDLRRFFLNGGRPNNKVYEAMNKDPIYFNINDNYQEIVNKLPLILKKKSRKSKIFLDKIIFVKSDIPKFGVDYNDLNKNNKKLVKKVSIVGLGYVGLTFALFLAKSGFKVIGIDSDKRKISQLIKKKTYVHEKGIEKILSEQLNKNLIVDNKIMGNSDVYIIAVSTPINKNKDIDTKNIINAVKNVASKISKGSLVIIRSTVPVGFTNRVIIPILEKHSKMKIGEDFNVSFAPERTLTGNAMKELMDLPQIISGYSKLCLDRCEDFFKNLNSDIIKVDKVEIAEMSKLMNNSIRDLKFSFSNQMAQICSKFDIDINKSIYASNQSYPRDLIPYPSFGVGGSCLTKDPYILSHVIKDKKSSLNFLARKVNDDFIDFQLKRIINEIKKSKKNEKNINIMICGLAFKGNPETSDIRKSTSIELAKKIKKKFKKVYGYDPLVDPSTIKKNGIIHAKIPRDFKNKDVIIFMTNHLSFKNIDFIKMIFKMNNNPIIFDVWNNFPKTSFSKSKSFKYMNLSVVKNYSNK